MQSYLPDQRYAILTVTCSFTPISGCFLTYSLKHPDLVVVNYFSHIGKM